LISAATCDYRYAGEISEIFGQSELCHLWVQQLTLVPLLGWQRDDIVRRNCLKPVSNRRMGRHEEFHIARRKSGLVSDIVSGEYGGTRRWSIIQNNRPIAPCGELLELLAFLAANAFVRFDRHECYAAISLGLEKSSEERGKIRSRRAEPEEQNRLRTVRKSSHE